MISGDAALTARWVDLSRITFHQHELRNPDRLLFFYHLLLAHPDKFCGPPLVLEPTGDGYYRLLDGHHKFLAACLAGRTNAPSVVIQPRVTQTFNAP
jgi:hypothetical protein